MVGEPSECRERLVQTCTASNMCQESISWIKVEIGRSVRCNLQVWCGAVQMVQPPFMTEKH